MVKKKQYFQTRIQNGASTNGYNKGELRLLRSKQARVFDLDQWRTPVTTHQYDEAAHAENIPVIVHVCGMSH